MVVEKLPGDQISIRVDAFLFQSNDEVINLNVDDQVLADVKVGSEYVLVFSRFRKNLLFRDQWEVNPEGPALAQQAVQSHDIHLVTRRALTNYISDQPPKSH